MTLSIIEDADASHEFALDRWRWRFSRPEKERAYQAWRVIEAVPYFRIGCLAALGTWLLGMLFAYLGFPEALPRLATIFVLLAAPLIAFTYALTYLPDRSALMIPFGAITNGGAGFAAVWVVMTTLDILGAASALMVFVAFFSFVLIRLPPVAAVLSVLPGIAYVIWALVAQYRDGHIGQAALAFYTFLPVATLLAGGFACYLLEVMMRMAFRDKCTIECQRQALLEERAQLSKFLAPEVERIVRERGISAALTRTTLDLTAVSCDLCGFTRYTEVSGPDKMSAVLAEYYGIVVEVARKYQATIKDFVGDGVLLLVGAPIERDDHAQAGQRMARELVTAVRAALSAHSSPATPLGARVGLASGPCAVGAIGSQSRLEYTAVGSAVNLSARLCASGADGEILYPAAGADAQKSPYPQSHRNLKLKGFAEDLRVCVETVS